MKPIVFLLLGASVVWIVWFLPPASRPLTKLERYCLLEQHLTNLRVQQVFSGHDLQTKIEWAQDEQKTISELPLSCAGVVIDDARLPAGSKPR